MTNERQEIDFLSASLTDIFWTMSEGFPGAVVALAESGKVIAGEPFPCFGSVEDRVLDFISSLDDMNIRGRQIWEAYQFFGKDAAKFVNSVNQREYGDEII